MRIQTRYTLVEVANHLGVETTTLTEYIRNEWLTPADDHTPAFDEEDLARCRLIFDLQQIFGVNNEGLPIILRLVDQIHLLQREVRKKSEPPLSRNKP